MVNLRERIIRILPTLPQPFSPTHVLTQLNLANTPSTRKAIRYHLDKLEEEGMLSLHHRGSRGEKYYTLTTTHPTHPTHPSRPTLAAHAAAPSLPPLPTSPDEGISITPRTHPADSIHVNAKHTDALGITTLLEEATQSASDAILITNITEKHITDTLTTLITLHHQHTFAFYLTQPINTDQLKRLISLENTHIIIPHTHTMHETIRTSISLAQRTAKSISIHTPSHPLTYPGTYGLYPAMSEDTLTITTHGALLIDYPKLARHTYSTMRSIILTHLRSLFTHTLKSTLTTPLRVKRIIHTIRFWNYGIKEDTSDPESIAAFLTSMHSMLREYAHSQEIILKSSGMPLAYTILLSILFDKAKPDHFTQRRFTPIKLSSIKDLIDNEDVKRKLREKERVTRIFTGGDRTRIFRTTPANPEDVLQEISLILNTYTIPLLTIDFSDAAHHASLKAYLKRTA